MPFAALEERKRSENSNYFHRQLIYVGVVKKVRDDGALYVSSINGDLEPVRAKITSRLAERNSLQLGDPVLLALCKGESLPIVIDKIEERADIKSELDPVVRIDGGSYLIEGRDQITIKCGRATISLTKEGKIILRGSEITSRASNTNKIKGSTVSLN